MGVQFPCAPEQLVAAEASPDEPDHIAASKLATSRAPTISGFPGNATAVATSTTGLIAGAESRNVERCGGRSSPATTSRPAMGTEPHSQPGRAAPATAATGTEYAARSGRTRGRKSGGTNAAIAALISTPRARNGIAWTKIETKIVAQCATAGRSSRS